MAIKTNQFAQAKAAATQILKVKDALDACQARLRKIETRTTKIFDKYKTDAEKVCPGQMLIPEMEGGHKIFKMVKRDERSQMADTAYLTKNGISVGADTLKRPKTTIPMKSADVAELKKLGKEYTELGKEIWVITNIASSGDRIINAVMETIGTIQFFSKAAPESAKKKMNVIMKDMLGNAKKAFEEIIAALPKQD